MHWKHDLIARVEARVHAAPVDLPPTWRLASAPPGVLDYLRVRLSGTYQASAAALVRAATERGTGYWLMVPLRLKGGTLIWINRGFVPAGTTVDQARRGVPAGRAEVVGLMRSSEPGGSMLQANRPREDRWYSRDVTALSRARRIGPSAPIFVDAQSEVAPHLAGGPVPVPGLTVVQFPDNHLQYALTWLAMAGLSLSGMGLVWRRSAAKSP